MARLARVVVPEVPHHIIQRGNRRMDVFFGEADYRSYLDLLGEHCTEHGVEIWAYCLMPNHVHLIAVPSTAENLALAIGHTHKQYTRRINFRENWRGFLWQGRFRSYPMDGPHLYMAARYIEQNPVRAKLVRQPWSYAWSSAEEHIKGKSRGVLTVTPLLEMVPSWKKFISADLGDNELVQIRKHSRTGRPAGALKFIEKIEMQLKRSIKPLKRGPKGPWKNKNA